MIAAGTFIRMTYTVPSGSNTSSITFAGYTVDFTVRGEASSPVQARLIDEKIDDGKPATGKFRGLNASLSSGGGIVANSMPNLRSLQPK